MAMRTRSDALKRIQEDQMKDEQFPMQGNPSDFFAFAPKPDITANELAILMKLFEITLQYEAVAKFPREMRRHFIGVPRSEPLKTPRKR